MCVVIALAATVSAIIPAKVVQAGVTEEITSSQNNSRIKSASDEIIELSIKAFANNRCNLGKRLFSSIGRKDGDVAFAYAKYFDKNSSVSSQCEQKNEKMAIYWYEKAYSLNESDEAQEALSKLKGE